MTTFPEVIKQRNTRGIALKQIHDLITSAIGGDPMTRATEAELRRCLSIIHEAIPEIEKGTFSA